MVKIKRYKLGHLRGNKKIGVCAILDCSNVFTGWDDRSFRKFCFFVISTAACTTSISEFKGELTNGNRFEDLINACTNPDLRRRLVGGTGRGSHLLVVAIL